MADGSSRARSWRAKLASLIAGVSASFALTTATPVQASPANPTAGSQPLELRSQRRFRKLVLRHSFQGNLRVAQHESHESHASHGSHGSHVSGGLI